jgi:hypothetical protein
MADELRYHARLGMNQWLDASEVLDANSVLQDQGHLVSCLVDLVVTDKP